MLRLFKVIGKGFQSVGFALGRFNTHLLMTLSYFLMLTPIGVLRRLFGRPEAPGWTPREKLPKDHFKKQY